jgi:gas vesicle protein
MERPEALRLRPLFSTGGLRHAVASAQGSTKENVMKTHDLFEILFGAGIGAAVMYLLDPDAGDQRREHLKEQTYNALATTGAAASAAWESTRDNVHTKYDQLRDIDLREQVRYLGQSHRRHDHDWSGSMGLIGAAVGAAALGAGLMFMLDPAQGKIRRSMVKTRAGRAAHSARGYWQNPRGRSGKPASPRAGASDHALGQSAPHFEAPSGSDEELAARVRQEIATGCSRPMDVYVTCRAGLVSLSGSLPIDEQDPVIARIRTLEGVGRVDNNLTSPNPIGIG